MRKLLLSVVTLFAVAGCDNGDNQLDVEQTTVPAQSSPGGQSPDSVVQGQTGSTAGNSVDQRESVPGPTTPEGTAQPNTGIGSP